MTIEGSSETSMPASVDEATGTNATAESGTINDQRIRILLVDDQVVLRRGLRAILEAQPDLEVVAEADDGLEGARLARILQPDIVLMDYQMPRLDGVEATRLIVDQWPTARVIGHSCWGNRRITAMMKAAGAAAFVDKGVPLHRLLDVIRDVYSRSVA